MKEDSASLAKTTNAYTINRSINHTFNYLVLEDKFCITMSVEMFAKEENTCGCRAHKYDRGVIQSEVAFCPLCAEEVESS
ncbi:hypothetical protein P8452_60186 [Trifolium repens]|nr:hypothetical protein P8452_60186 [Trifolium repens]